MNILLVTELFPLSLEDNRLQITFALYDIYRRLPPDTIRVIRPVHTGFRKILQSRTQSFTLGPLSCCRLPIPWKAAIGLRGFGIAAHGALHWLQDQDFRPDMVIGHFREGMEIGRRLSKKLKIPFMPVFHESNYQEARANIKPYRKNVESGALVGCRSRNLLQRMGELFPDRAPQLRLVDSGLDTSQLLPRDLWKRKSRELIRKKSFSILTVSSFAHRKHVPAVLEALAMVPHAWTRYTIVGRGEEAELIRQKVRELGLENKVVIMDYQPRHKVMEIMRSHDVFILSSERETVGLVYLEAVAAGMFVIAARGTGVDGTLRDRKECLLSIPGNPESIAEQLNAFVSLAPEERSAMLVRARTFACNSTYEKIVFRMVDSLAIDPAESKRHIR